MSAKLGEILVRENLISPQHLRQALDYQREHGGRLGYNLVKLGLVSDDTITAVVQHQCRRSNVLDEIGDLPLLLQGKILRLVQEKQFERVGGVQTLSVDVRVVAATNRDLARAITEGRFREDLFYRLNVFPIHLPPLKERREDVPLLVHHFIEKFNGETGKHVQGLSPGAMGVLQGYGWPGNIRELRNVIERAMILSRGSTLQIKLGHPALRQPAANAAGTLEEAEREHIFRALERCGWRIRGSNAAAELLGMKPTTLESRIKKLGLVQRQ
jgi:transcriptional regulator with GAF, ATPase, and Fis domain